MSPDQARTQLSHENITITALTLAALDHLQAEDYVTMEPKLLALGKFSESDIVVMGNKALKDHAFAAVPANGNGIKINLSSFVNGLMVIGMVDAANLAMKAEGQYETNPIP